MSTLKRKRIAAVVLTACLLMSGFAASASAPYRPYAYSLTDEGFVDVAAPQAYMPEKIYSPEDMQISLSSPEDMLIDDQGNFYICDAGTNTVEVLSPDFKPVRSIGGFDNNGTPDAFSSPTGIFIDRDGRLYIADSGNRRVVVLNRDGRLVRLLETPQSEVLPDNFEFIPQKVLVDNSQRIFVLCKNVFEGILQFSESGSFIGYVGSNTVVASPFTLLWKTLLSEVQRGKLESFVPVEYTNVSLDYKGFIYAVTSVKNVDSPIRRLNPSGNDVLVRAPLNGTKQVVGDVMYSYVSGPSSFVDITSDEKGNYYALDSKRGRVFAYDEDGNMLFVFGSMNSGQKGSFVSPSALAYQDGRLYALDRTLCQVIVFEPTDYVLQIQKAMDAYIRQDFEQCVVLWEDLIRRNGNFDLAYMKAGYALYRLKEYDKAMVYFKLVGAKEAYSDAYVKSRKIWLNDHFEWVAGGGLAAAALLTALIICARRWLRRHRERKRGRLTAERGG